MIISKRVVIPAVFFVRQAIYNSLVSISKDAKYFDSYESLIVWFFLFYFFVVFLFFFVFMVLPWWLAVIACTFISD